MGTSTAHTRDQSRRGSRRMTQYRMNGTSSHVRFTTVRMRTAAAADLNVPPITQADTSSSHITVHGALVVIATVLSGSKI